jgi:glycosyltransferase involved in cell wall biosynthesis
MKVLQVIDKLNIGGAERVFVDMVNILSKTDLSVEVLLFDDTGRLTEDLNERIVVHNLDRKNKFSLSKLYRAHKLCVKFDIVHVHMRHCYAYIKLAQIIFRGNYKILLHDHFGDIDIDTTVPFRLKHWLEPEYYVGVSQSLATWAKAHLKGTQIHLLRNIVIPGKGVTNANRKNRKAFMVANIRRTKNIEFAITLCRELGIELTIYGNKTDDTYWQELMAMIEPNGKIKIVQGVSDVSLFYGDYSFALHCATSETGPLVLLEYMANSMPFIAYKTGEVAELLAPHLPSCFVNSFETEEWNVAIENIISSSESTSARMRNIFDDMFSVEKYKEECLKIYQSVYC